MISRQRSRLRNSRKHGINPWCIASLVTLELGSLWKWTSCISGQGILYLEFAKGKAEGNCVRYGLDVGGDVLGRRTSDS